MEADLAERLRQAQWTSTQTKAFAVPEGRHGWRGLGLAGDHKRKVYTVLHNEQVLVTALLLLPGERGMVHSHESGELSIHFDDPMEPSVSWHPPGEVHGGRTGPGVARQLREVMEAIKSGPSTPPEVVGLAAQLSELLQVPQLAELVQTLVTPDPRPRVLIDILFPPFKTTIEDPSYPRKTFIGQWYD